MKVRAKDCFKWEKSHDTIYSHCCSKLKEWKILKLAQFMFKKNGLQIVDMVIHGSRKKGNGL